MVDTALDDESLLELTPEKKAQWPTRPQDISAFEVSFSEQKPEKIEKLQRMNSGYNAIISNSDGIGQEYLMLH